MTQAPSQAAESHPVAAADTAPPPAGFPTIPTALADGDILGRLDRASRRGKLPGFHKGDGGGAEADTPLFWLEVFGKYFNRRLLARVAAAGPDRVIRFKMRTRPLAVWVFWVATILTVWPGVALTDSLLATYFSRYPRSFWFTCAWYLPLTILPVPWMWSCAWRDSTRIADAEARELIAKVAAHLGSATESPSAVTPD